MKTADINKSFCAGIYCRLSKDDNDSKDVSASISTQKDMLIKYVQDRGWTLTRIYADDGYSGVNFERPDFKAMVKDIEDGIINVVITKDVSRLGRNYAITGYYTDTFFPEHGVRFIAVNDSIDSDIENDITPFKHVLNEMYAKDISRKTRSARRTLAEKGKFATSKPPYGYMKSPENRHQLIIDETVADNVRRIYEMFLSGKSGRHIADVFNKEGIPSPGVYYYILMNKPALSNTQWGSGTILSILRNPAYKGELVSGKRRVTSFKNKKMVMNPPETWIVVENAHEAIISGNTWDEAQKIISKNHVGVRRGGIGEVALFSGIAKCGDCGAKMTFNRKAYKDSTKEYYRCGRYTNKGKTACGPHTILEGTIYMSVIEDIRAFVKLAYSDEQQLIGRLTDDNMKHSAKLIQRQESLLLKKENRLAEIDLLVQSLFEDKVSGSVPENIF